MHLERVILSNLLFNEDYGRKVAPFLRPNYFDDVPERVVYELISDYLLKYNAFPTREALVIDLSNATGLNEQNAKRSEELVTTLERDPDTKLEWLLDSTEKWCQDRSIYIALMESISIVEKKGASSISKGAIPQILQDALAVSFDTHIGHDFIEDSDARYEFYHRKEKLIPFDLHYMNEVTGGGLANKTLMVIMAGTNVGKSLCMCHMAAANLAAGYRVLYITMEMAEERIAERIDANLLDVTMEELKFLTKAVYDKRIEKLRGSTNGRLVIKEYPTATAGAANFRHLLNELKIKKNFKPDVIYIDYINICASSRLKYGANVNSYTYIKAIAEEIRGLAVEYDVPIVSATQVNRGGFSSSDMEITDTSESFGLPATADYMFGLTVTDELAEMGQIMVKQLKNRYGNKSINKRFVIGADLSKMRLYDVEGSAQEGVLDGPVMDRTKFGMEDRERSRGRSKLDKRLFEGFS